MWREPELRDQILLKPVLFPEHFGLNWWNTRCRLPGIPFLSINLSSCFCAEFTSAAVTCHISLMGLVVCHSDQTHRWTCGYLRYGSVPLLTLQSCTYLSGGRGRVVHPVSQGIFDILIQEFFTDAINLPPGLTCAVNKINCRHNTLVSVDPVV